MLILGLMLSLEFSLKLFAYVFKFSFSSSQAKVCTQHVLVRTRRYLKIELF